MTVRSRFLAAAALLLPAQVYAHHATGGEMPDTFSGGMLSGLAHPVIGLDHLLFLLMAAVLASSLGSPSRYVAPAVFVAGALFGVNLHLAEVNIPLAEALISLSIVASGAFVWLRWRIEAGPLFLLMAASGVFHGYAYAESILGAESTPLLAYLIGLAVIQFAVIAGVVIGLNKARGLPRVAYAGRFAGGAALVGGVLFLASSLA